jgi:hypothetical protein
MVIKFFNLDDIFDLAENFIYLFKYSILSSVKVKLNYDNKESFINNLTL